MSKHRLLSVTFRDNAGPLAGYAAIGKGGGGVDSIVPASLMPDGTWRAVDKERADGLGIVRSEGVVTARAERRYFVPMGNVASIAYELVEEPKAAK